MTSIVAQREQKDLSKETLVGEKTQQNFLNIDFNQVKRKTLEFRILKLHALKSQPS